MQRVLLIMAAQVRHAPLSQVLFKMDENGSGVLIELSRLGQVEGGKLQVLLALGPCSALWVANMCCRYVLGYWTTWSAGF